MFGYGKMSGSAVAAMSALAEVHPTGRTLSSQEIAASRNLSQPLVGKVMTILSQHGLVIGSRGPGGGYRMATKPDDVSLFQVVELFEGHRNLNSCPFGPGWCGVGEPCPLHDSLVAISESAEEALRSLSFASFIDHPKQSP